MEDQLRRSHEYESSSLKSNVPLQLVIYGVTITISLIVFAFLCFLRYNRIAFILLWLCRILKDRRWLHADRFLVFFIGIGPVIGYG